MIDKTVVQIGNKTCRVEAGAATSIAIPLDFDGPQPSHFGAQRASRRPLEQGTFRGRTQSGSGCNVDVLTILPHCNGTHTETVGHIVNQRVDISKVAMASLHLAVLLTVSLRSAKSTEETYRPDKEECDWLITRSELELAWGQHGVLQSEALVIRTIPNSIQKQSWNYSSQQPPAFFTLEAMEMVNALGVDHLLVDIPSVDRMHDNGWLTNHHLFWNVPEQSRELPENAWQHKTITEMVFVPTELLDGVYGLSLQIPPFCTDAAPSRPILFPLVEELP